MSTPKFNQNKDGLKPVVSTQIFMMNKKTKSYPATLDSGKLGWRARLQTVYDNYEEFAAFAETYGLQARFGRAWNETLFEIWVRNPVIQGSTDPADHRASDMRDVVAFVSGFRDFNPDAELPLALSVIDAARGWRDELIGLAMIVEDCRLDPDCIGDAILLVEALGTTRRLDGEVYAKATGEMVGDSWDMMDPSTGELPPGMEECALSSEAIEEKYRDIVEDCRSFIKEVDDGAPE